MNEDVEAVTEERHSVYRTHQQEEQERSMIPIADAVVDKWTMVVISFDALAAYSAMNSSRRPQTPTKETEIIQVPIIFQCLIQVNVELL